MQTTNESVSPLSAQLRPTPAGSRPIVPLDHLQRSGEPHPHRPTECIEMLLE